MAKNKSVAVATNQINVPKTAQEVPIVIEQLKVQLAALKGNTEEKISLDVEYDGEKIKDIKTVKELLSISASLHARNAAYNVEIIRYGLENANIQPFSQEDKTVEEWNKIIAKAINELINAVQIKNLEDAISGLSEHLDAETKLQMKLEKLVTGASQFVR